MERAVILSQGNQLLFDYPVAPPKMQAAFTGSITTHALRFENPRRRKHRRRPRPDQRENLRCRWHSSFVRHEAYHPRITHQGAGTDQEVECQSREWRRRCRRVWCCPETEFGGGASLITNAANSVNRTDVLCVHWWVIVNDRPVNDGQATLRSQT